MPAPACCSNRHGHNSVTTESSSYYSSSSYSSSVTSSSSTYSTSRKTTTTTTTETISYDPGARALPSSGTGTTTLAQQPKANRLCCNNQGKRESTKRGGSIVTSSVHSRPEDPDSYGTTTSSSHRSSREQTPSSQQTTSSSSSSSRSYTSVESSQISSYTGSSSLGDEAAYDTDAILAQHGATYKAISAPPNASMIYEIRRQFTPYISVGPIIGMVTETTVRILIESSATVEVKCFLTDAFGVQHGVIMQCSKGIPTAFVFEELRAGTKYRVSFDLPVPGLVKSSFTTLAANWSVKDAPARIAVVSSNDLRASRDAVPHQMDLWKSLYQENARKPFNYCLHLGNNVFFDTKDYVDTRDEGRVLSHKATNVFQDALDFCSGLDGSILHEAEGHVCELIRNLYRDTWNQPCVRHCLANMPNLMICGPTDLGQSFYSDDDTDPARVFVQNCAYKVYNEYCRALFEDVEATSTRPVKISQAYHFHAFGDVGILFIDSKAHALFHKSRHDAYEVPYLGKKQWNDIDYALSEGGYVSLCKVLLVCTTFPIAQVSEAGWYKAKESGKMDLAETWNTPAGVAEASLLLSKLFDWKNRRQGTRDVVLLAGSLTDGGLSTIYDNRYEQGIDQIQQIVAGQISGDCFKGTASLANASVNTGLGVYHSFKHMKVVPTRSFATVTIERNPEVGTINLDCSHLAGTSKAVTSIKHKI